MSENEHSDLSPGEIYAIEMNNHEPGYYSQIPGVLHHLTYIKKEIKKSKKYYGKKIRCKLSSTAFQLYCYLKQIAGKKNKPVWSHPKNIAEAIGCSLSKFYEAKEELLQGFEQLNGKPLISIVKSKKYTERQDKQKGASVYDQITICHVWPEANAYMATKKYTSPEKLGIVDNTDGFPPNGKASDGFPPNGKASPGTIPPNGKASLGDSLGANNNPSYQDSICIDTELTDESASVCFPKEEKSVNPLEECAILKKKAEDSLRFVQCDENFIKEVLKKYSPQRIIDGGWYTMQQKARGKIKNNFFGYLRNAIENKRKWQNK